MAIDPNWVRENPKEAARQLDMLSNMHVDRVRHIWESRGFGACDEMGEAFDSLENKYRALSTAKLEPMPTDLKSRFLVIKVKGDIGRAEARAVMQGFSKHSSGVAIFVNEEVDLEAIDMTKRDALIKAKALFDMSERLEAYHQPIAANQCWNAGDKLRRQAEGVE